MSGKLRVVILVSLVIGFAAAFFYLATRKGEKRKTWEAIFSPYYTDQTGLNALETYLNAEKFDVYKSYHRLVNSGITVEDILLVIAPPEGLSFYDMEEIESRVSDGTNALLSFRRGDNYLSEMGLELMETNHAEDYQKGELRIEKSTVSSWMKGVKTVDFFPDETQEIDLGYFNRSKSTHDFLGYHFRSDTLNLIPVLESKGEVHAAIVPYGKGKIFLFSNPFIFTNKGLGKADNAMLVANVFKALKKDHDGRVIFDEYHQGFHVETIASPLNVAEVKYMILALLITFMIAVFSLSRRVVKPVSLREEPRRSIFEFIQSMARIYGRRGSMGFVYAEVVNRFLFRSKSALGFPMNENIKPEPRVVELAVKKWGQDDAKEFMRVLNMIFANRGEVESTDLLETIQRIRFFSIKNKLDIHATERN